MKTKANKARPASAPRRGSPTRALYGPQALSWLPALIGMGILFYTSSLPGDEIHLPPFPYSDKAVHFAAYAVLGILIAWRKGLQGSPADGRPDWIGIIVGMLYAAGDEIHQLFVPLRMFDFSDMAADFLGVAAGVWAYRKLSGRRQARG